MKNRESANKSRVKRKNEKMTLEQTVAELTAKVQQLQQENDALQADNCFLSNQNSELKTELAKYQNPKVAGFSSMSVFCIVFAFSFVFGFNDYNPLPSLIHSSHFDNTKNSGRILLATDDQEFHHFEFGRFVQIAAITLVAIYVVLQFGFKNSHIKDIFDKCRNATVLPS